MHELLAAIYENPHDDEARLVYADWLTDRGDPLGEFISLQFARNTLTREKRLRERQLLKTNRKKWLGKLVDVTARKGQVFRRGFPAVARVRLGLEADLDVPEWGTIEEARGLSYESIERTRRLPRGLIELEITRGQASVALLRRIAGQLTRVRRLGLVGNALGAAEIMIMMGLIWEGLRTLKVEVKTRVDIGVLHRELADRLDVLYVQNAGRVYHLRKDTLEFTAYWPAGTSADAIRQILAASGQISRVLLHVSEYHAQDGYFDTFRRALGYDVEVTRVP